MGSLEHSLCVSAAFEAWQELASRGLCLQLRHGAESLLLSQLVQIGISFTQFLHKALHLRCLTATAAGAAAFQWLGTLPQAVQLYALLLADRVHRFRQAAQEPGYSKSVIVLLPRSQATIRRGW